MAKGKNTIVLMVPEGERKSYKYSFTINKSATVECPIKLPKEPSHSFFLIDGPIF